MKILSDYHVHTSFSGDCSVSPELMIQNAIERGIRHLCLTDHMDYDYTDGGILFEFDPEEYFHRLLLLKETYAGQIDLAIGIELGLQPYLSKRHHNLVFSHPFDFVIGSLHVVDGKDPYYRDLFSDLTDRELYQKTFEEMYACLMAADAFDVLGLRAVNADTIVKNTRSQHVLEKVGFQYLKEEDGFRYYRLQR